MPGVFYFHGNKDTEICILLGMEICRSIFVKLKSDILEILGVGDGATSLKSTAVVVKNKIKNTNTS